jgi:alpha-galactosidase
LQKVAQIIFKEFYMIKFNEQTKIFHLQTPNSSYQILISHKGHLAHVYYGTKIGDDDLSYLTRQMEYGFSGQEIFREKHFFEETRQILFKIYFS